MDDKLANFHKSVKQIEKTVGMLLNSNLYDSLTTREKISHDLFLAYTFNTLYWLYLRSKGVNPQEEPELKDQLNRVKTLMVSVKNEDDMKLRPKVDRGAASRFIKHGINHKNEKDDDTEPPRKKLKS